jgi:sugar O-acyltransferase (sialic acid O-acetyltransferase NeuD family)
MKDKLLIIGASGHGKVVADIALKMNNWNSIKFIDDDKSLKSSLGLDIVGTSVDINKFISEYDVFVGVGNNIVRKNIIEKLEKLGATIPVLIHPTAIIGKEVMVDSGTVVMAGTVINSSTSIGKGCIVNTGSTIDHDNIIEDYVHISPGAHLAGSVSIGEGTWIGVGSIISNNIIVCKNCTVGAGGVVVKNITEVGTYIGVPVKRISNAKK